MKKVMPEQEFSQLDISFARFLLRFSGLKAKEAEQFFVRIQQLSAALNRGDSCISLSLADSFVQNLPEALCISEKEYQKGSKAPLVFFAGKLFLYRYFHYEFQLASQLRERALQKETLTESSLALLDPLFPNSGEGEDAERDYQKEAALLAVERKFAMISGGPGTGKTTTVVKILALLLSEAKYTGLSLPKIVLTAPTGRAAMRLGESVSGSVEGLAIDEEVKVAIPCTATTLHQLLGVRRNSSHFVHHRENLLNCSVVVVDEASMVDLALMSKLVDALPPDCRLILLGDKDQLASVESGAVLAELLKALPQCGVQLKKSYRFNNNIKELALSVNAGNATAAWSFFEDNERNNLSLLEGDAMLFLGRQVAVYMEAVQEVLLKEDVTTHLSALFASLRSFQVLCATRKGRRGVEQVNGSLVRLLAAKGLVHNKKNGWYAGRPVMITRNDYTLGLFNGDVGICLPDLSGELTVWFERPDGRMFSVACGRLPKHETAFAITIHKSQGSEFDEVAVLLPEKLYPGFGRELLYTGITRAKNKVWLLGEEDIFAAALKLPVLRQSGLQELFMVV